MRPKFNIEIETVKMKHIYFHIQLLIAITFLLFACNSQRETSDFLQQVQANIAYLAATVSYRDSVQLYEQLLQESVYEAQQTTNYQKYQYKFYRYQYKHAQMLLQKQRKLILFLLVCFIISLIAFFIHRRMLRNRDKVLSLQAVKDTLRKTNNNLLQKLATNEMLTDNKLHQEQQQRFDIIWRLLLQKAQLADKTKKTVNEVISQCCKAIFGKNNPQSWDILAEIIEESNPGLLSFIKSNYSFSDTEYKVAVLSFVNINLKIKEIAAILEKEHAHIHKTRSSIRSKMNLTDKSIDFHTVLKQKYYSSKAH